MVSSVPPYLCVHSHKSPLKTEATMVVTTTSWLAFTCIYIAATLTVTGWPSAVVSDWPLVSCEEVSA